MSALEGAILRTLREAGIEKPPVEVERVLRFLDLDDICWSSDQQVKQVALIHSENKGKHRILMPTDYPAERLPFTLAHECVEYIALREGLKPLHWKINQSAAELLLPTSWVRQCISDEGFDLFALQRRFSTASLETCAFKMLGLATSPCILTVADRKGMRRRSYTRKALERPISHLEEEVLAEAFCGIDVVERVGGGLRCRAFPVPDRRRGGIARVFLFAFLLEL
ncbi:MAG: hypothetical protein NTV14_00925 [Coprothermobacterota bacterium]|nr:hypothetical protein [Coprothermobacterota bacterium]